MPGTLARSVNGVRCEKLVLVVAVGLAATSAAGALASGVSTPSAGPGSDAVHDRTFVIEQPTLPPLATPVQPLSNGDRVETFYDPSYGLSATGLEQPDTSIIFLWEGPNGTSLVVVHDKGGTAGGGAATLNFTGYPAIGVPSQGPLPAIPGEGSWVVKDDPRDFDPPSEPPNVVSWSWLEYYNDGGAYRGGMDGAFTVRVEPAFDDAALEDPRDPGTIDDWVLLSGDLDDPTEIPLDMETPLLIEGTP